MNNLGSMNVALGLETAQSCKALTSIKFDNPKNHDPMTRFAPKCGQVGWELQRPFAAGWQAGVARLLRKTI